VDVDKMLVELRKEREQIDEAILTLERLAKGRGKRRGRPPAWLKDAAAAVSASSSESAESAPLETKRKGRGSSGKNILAHAAEA
jgi:hypothetical protein